MCGQGVDAHGSGNVVIAGVAVPHDSAVPTDAECTRVCNTQPPPAHAGTDQSRPAEVRPDPCDLQPRDIAPRTGVTECDRSRRGVRPISARSATDLGTECDRSRGGIRPISTRNRTDLDAEPDRSRRKGRRVRQAGGQAVRSLRLLAAPATRSSTTASTRQTPGPTHGPPGPSRSRAPPLAPAVPASSTGR